MGMKKVIGLMAALAMSFPVYQMPERAIVEEWGTSTGLRDSVSLWGFSHRFVIKPTGGLVLRNGLVEVRPFQKNTSRR